MNAIDRLSAEQLRPGATLDLGREPGSTQLPMRLQVAQGDARTLVVTFHGAVDRETRKVPAYSPLRAELVPYAHQLSVSDPTMLQPGDFRIAWYAGHAGHDVQTAVREAIEEIRARLGAERVIFCGSSGGGFAALYNAWHMPGSLCLAISPQTSIARYYPRLVSAYLAQCWPGVQTVADLPESVCTDVCALYAQGFPSTVVYLQSAGDYFHFSNHLLPFLAQADIPEKNSAFLLENGFWGRLSHSGSVTHAAWMPWLRAAVAAPDFKTDTLLQARHAYADSTPAQASAPQPPRPAASAPPTSGPRVSAADTAANAEPDAETARLARTVTDWLLRS